MVPRLELPEFPSRSLFSKRDDIREHDLEPRRMDKYILYCLQDDARNVSSRTIAERMGVSASTVRNRIHQLEDDGIITGYSACVDFEAAGSQLHTLVVCTAPIPERSRLARQALQIDGVVDVREIMTGGERPRLGRRDRPPRPRSDRGGTRRNRPGSQRRGSHQCRVHERLRGLRRRPRGRVTLVWVITLDVSSRFPWDGPGGVWLT